jgi:hypothetical protein
MYIRTKHPEGSWPVSAEEFVVPPHAASRAGPTIARHDPLPRRPIRRRPPASSIWRAARSGWPRSSRVVARLNSQDLETGASSTRLILRFESLTDPDRQPRIHSVCADSLEEMDDATLRTLVSRPTAKARRVLLLQRNKREAESGD